MENLRISACTARDTGPQPVGGGFFRYTQVAVCVTQYPCRNLTWLFNSVELAIRITWGRFPAPRLRVWRWCPAAWTWSWPFSRGSSRSSGGSTPMCKSSKLIFIVGNYSSKKNVIILQ